MDAWLRLPLGIKLDLSSTLGVIPYAEKRYFNNSWHKKAKKGPKKKIQTAGGKFHFLSQLQPSLRSCVKAALGDTSPLGEKKNLRWDHFPMEERDISFMSNCQIHKANQRFFFFFFFY
mgnify:CR=1 FL=1